MKKIFLALLFGLSVQLYAQSKFYLGLISSVDITGMVRDDKYVVFGDVGFDKIGLGYQGGLRLRYQISSIFSLQTGFTMVSHQLRTPRIYLNPLSSDDLFYSFVRMPSVKIFQVPVLASFYFGHNLKLGGTLGLSYNYIYRFDEKSIASFNDGEKEFTNTQKVSSQNQYLATHLGLGVEYSHNKFTFRVEPSGSYQLHFFDSDFANDNYRLWSAGLALSTYYRF